MSNEFELMPWHDAELQELSIDRRRAGHSDVVRLKVRWPDGKKSELLFRECYAMIASMNFGIIGVETIADATVVESDSDLDALVARWKELGVNLDRVRCYRIETASTASIIRIFAECCEVM